MPYERLYKSMDNLSALDLELQSEEEILEEYEQLSETKEVLSLKDLALKYPFAYSEENFNKNRYRNVLPLEHSRVKLESSDSDYINANHIPSLVSGSTNSFISTQAPIPFTFKHFWLMVWQQRSPMIIMLTKLFEKGRKKADQYWSEEVDVPLIFGDIEINFKSLQKIGSIHIRHLLLTRGNETREIVHIHYPEWPDHGVPEETTEIRDLIQKIQFYRELGSMQDLGGPPIVHCSAGLGRSGTLISILLCLEKLSKDSSDINIQDTVRHLRNHRSNMVQTPDQYLLIYRIMQDLIKESAHLKSPRKLHRTFSSPRCLRSSSMDFSQSPPPHLAV